MQIFVMAVLLSAVSGVLTAVFPGRRTAGGGASVLPLLPAALGSVFLYAAGHGEISAARLLNGGARSAPGYGAAALPFAAAVLFLYFAVYRPFGRSDMPDGTLSGRLRVFIVLLAVLASLPAAACMGILPAFAFLFFPGRLFRRNVSAWETVPRAVCTGALAGLAGLLLKAGIPGFPEGLSAALVLLPAEAFSAFALRKSKKSVRIG